jgi:four helix bundle protein
MRLTSFRDLRVWQLSMELVEIIYRLTQNFPKHEIYGLTSQIQRAAVSVPSNIAEGHTREHTREFLHHLSIAQASLAELETQLEIALRLNYLARDEFDRILERVVAPGKQQYALRNALLKRLKT